MSSPEAHTAYRAGNCITCHTKPYSAGRTRCQNCHEEYVEQLARGEI